MQTKSNKIKLDWKKNYSFFHFIQHSSYEDMLKRNRYEIISNDSIFQGNMGKCFDEVIRMKGSKLSSEEKIRISKRISWF